VFTGHDLVQSSLVLSATGSVVIALPRAWSRVVRPYVSIGPGLIHVSSTDIAGIFPIASTRAAVNVGAGAWLRMTERLGVRAEARFVRAIASSSRFETWRTTAGVSVRF
jgi:hypothetical protein